MYIDIKAQLEKCDLTRYELARRVGVTYPTITTIYNGNSASVKLDILEKMCTEFNCTPNDILKFGELTDGISNKCDFMNPPE